MVTDQPIQIGNWCPKNYGGSYYGRVFNFTEAIARSLNSIPVQLPSRSAASAVADRRAPSASICRRSPDRPFVIGSVEVHMIDHVAGFATFRQRRLLGFIRRRSSRSPRAPTAVLWDREARAPPPNGSSRRTRSPELT